MHGYRAYTVFDGDRVLTGGALVLVEGETIVGVEPASAPAPGGCPVDDLSGATLLPGLVDTHTHLCADSGPGALDRIPDLTPSEIDDVVTAALRRQLAAGVTSVRDLGDHRFAVVERHRGRPGLPTVVASGPPLTSPRGHCWSMGGEVSGVEAIRLAVRERAERGADVVKVMASGGMLTGGTDVFAPQFAPAELRALVDEAHRRGLPVTAHAHALVAVRLAVEAGVDGVEHCTCLTADGLRLPAELAAALAAGGTAVCATMGHVPGVEPPPHLLAALERAGATPQALIEHLAALHRAGVRLVAGADSGIGPRKPHGVLPHTLLEHALAGIPPAEVLASATGVAADVCGLAGRTGRLRPGLAADLLVVQGDATRDLGALTRVRTVLLRGEPVVSTDACGSGAEPDP